MGLVSAHGFGSLAIILYDGRLLALGIVRIDDDTENNKDNRYGVEARRRRSRVQRALRLNKKQKLISITWGTNAYEAVQHDRRFRCLHGS